MLITCMKTHSMLVLLLICVAKGVISTTIDYDVGVILDMDSAVGRIGNSCLWMAHSDFYADHADYKTRLLLHPINNSGNNVVDVAAAALYLLKDVKVDAIIGPQESALDLVIKMGNMAHVPVISFSATTPLINQAPYFVRTAHSDANQVEAIASVVKAYKWSKVVIIYEDSGIIPYLFNALNDVNARVPYKSMLSKSANNDSISKELNKMRSMPTRVFVVHVSQSLGINFFQQVHKLGMMTEGYVWIVTTELMDLFNFGISGDDDVEAMLGVLGVRPLIPNSVDRLNSCGGRGRSVFCIWACDTLSALAMAVERVGNNATENEADDNSSGPFAVGVSKMGPKIYKALLETRFTGLSGEFNLINGQLGQTAYQIFNIVGSSKKQVGIWTPSKEENTSSEFNLKRNIIWPGVSTKAPRGWEFPANGSKLRIAVPLKPGFDMLFKVVIDNKTKETSFTGDYKNLFDAIMKRLPYTIPHEFKAYQLHDPNRTYDDLMHNVSLQIEYDGALGDFTVTAKRSNYVDFTVPYAEGGVACIVPMKQETGGVWAFLKPLTTYLWIAILIFYIYTSLIVWVLSKRIIQSPDFQNGMIHSFPFFPGGGIEANLLRVIVVLWGVVAKLVWATYTASLASILTAPRLVPTVTSMAQLKQEGYVGYQKSSFLKSYLIHLKFNESKLKSFSTYEDVHKALSQGQGGKNISGYCDVMPYINYILSNGCGNYTTIYPVYQTVGFAMAFPKGFPAVDDISRAILEMIDDGTILLYKNETSNPWEYCGDSGTSRESLKSFSMLLAISGCVILACFVGSLLYGKHRQTSLLREVGLARLDRNVTDDS